MPIAYTALIKSLSFQDRDKYTGLPLLTLD